MVDIDRLLTPHIAAKRLGLPEDRSGVRQINRLIQAGKLKAENHGTGKQRPRWRIRESALAEYMRGVTEAPERKDVPEVRFLRQERRDRLHR